MAVRREYISDLYRNVLGREGSDQEVSGWENAPDEQSVSNMFYSSPEYTSTHGGTAGWQDVGGQIVNTPPANMPPPTDSPYQISGGGNHGYATTPTRYSTSAVPNQTSTATDPNARARSGLASVYKQFLGRDASESELNNWLSGSFGYGSGAGDYDKFVAAILGSPEARAYKPSAPAGDYHGIEYWQSKGVPTGDIVDAMTGQTRPGWSRTGTGYERSTSTPAYTGFNTRGNDYSAFNTSREQDPNKSAKDAFAMLSNQAPAPPFGSKAAMANWFNTYVRPGMDALGHKVTSVSEDGFTYTNPEGTFTVDFGQNSGAAAGTARQRLQWNATPADAATAARYAGAGGGGAGTGSGGGGTGSGSTVSNLRDIYQALGQQYGGPGGPGITKGELQQVGQDPLSQLITGALANFIGAEGTTGFGAKTQQGLTDLIDNGGELDPGQVARRYESARELLDKGRRTMVNDLRGDLASRNLLSEPGIPQGAEIGGLSRITEKLAPEFSRALRDIYTDESAKADTRLMSALQMATGFSTDQARNLLAGIGEGTARQTALSDLALRELQTNMAWNQFLAQFGLERDKVLYDIQNGGIEQLLPILQLFIQQSGLSNAGYA